MTTESIVMRASLAVPTTPAFPSRDSPMLMLYHKPKANDNRRTALDNEEQIQNDAELHRRYSIYYLLTLYIVTLNRLLGCSDVVNDLKKSFVYTLYTPSN
jgi:hypothetical protein